MGTIKERKNRQGKLTFYAEVRRKGLLALYKSFSRLTDARTWIQDTESDMRRGRYVPSDEQRRHTLGEAVVRFIEDEFPKWTRPSDNERRHLEWFRTEVGDRTLAEITPALLTELRSKFLKGMTRFKEPRKPQTWNRYLSSISCVLQLCCRDWEWMEVNPVRRVKREREAPGRVRFLSDDERARLLAAAQQSRSPNLYPLVLTALSTGMRRAEILRLRWSQVDLQAGCILLTKTKNKETRRVPLRGTALEAIRAHARIRRIDTDLVFPGEKTSSSDQPFSLDNFWYKTLRAAKISDFRFHDLRHSAASYLAMSGASLLEIAEVLGHKTLQMVKRYSHLSESHTASVVERMNKKFLGA